MTLKQIMDPASRFVFLVHQNQTDAFQIVHVEDEALFFIASRQDLPFYEKAFVIGAESKGIVEWNEPALNFLEQKQPSPNDLHVFRLRFQQEEIRIVNRRQDERFEPDRLIPIAFNHFGEDLLGQLVDLSEGGLKLRVETKVSPHTRFHLRLKVPLKDKAVELDSDGVVLHCEKNGPHYDVGIKFVSPEAATISFDEFRSRVKRVLSAWS